LDDLTHAGITLKAERAGRKRIGASPKRLSVRTAWAGRRQHGASTRSCMTG
jgi:hypothetical protein